MQRAQQKVRNKIFIGNRLLPSELPLGGVFRANVDCTFVIVVSKVGLLFAPLDIKENNSKTVLIIDDVM
jgi:hypothetical protein